MPAAHCRLRAQGGRLLLAAAFFALTTAAHAREDTVEFFETDDAAVSSCAAFDDGGSADFEGTRNPGETIYFYGPAPPLPPGGTRWRGYVGIQGGSDGHHKHCWGVQDGSGCPAGQTMDIETGICGVEPDPPGEWDESCTPKTYRVAGWAGGGGADTITLYDPPGCLAKKRGMETEGWTTYGTDGSYTDPESPSAPPTPDPGTVSEAGPDSGASTTCVTGTNGAIACQADHPPNCGTFNGAPVCLDSVPAGNCSFVGGGMVCSSDAPTTITPDNGTAGTPAQPDLDVTLNEPGTGSKEYHYYSPGTVGLSDTPPGDAGTATAGEDGNGIDETGVFEAGTIDGEGDEHATIYDDLLDQAGSAPDLGTLDEGSVDGSLITGMLPAGVCSPLTLDHPSGTIVLDGHTKLQPVREGLAWVFAILSTFTILMLIARAPRAAGG